MNTTLLDHLWNSLKKRGPTRDIEVSFYGMMNNTYLLHHRDKPSGQLLTFKDLESVMIRYNEGETLRFRQKNPKGFIVASNHPDVLAEYGGSRKLPLHSYHTHYTVPYVTSSSHLTIIPGTLFLPDYCHSAIRRKYEVIMVSH